jgi:aminopeptidase N
LRDSEPKTIRLSEYQAPALQIREVDLTFDIQPGTTTVTSLLKVIRTSDGSSDLRLDGQDLELVSVRVDGERVSENACRLDDESLTLFDLPDECEIEVVNRICPEENTALEGLYKSRTMYCTQCEAEGFRKITYYQDRPDVLAKFTTTIIANADYPVLLSNGNPVASERLDDGRARVTWEDPFPKPSYLFALVAGDLALLTDSFTTMSGRNVELRIYSESHNIDQCDYAMDVLKRSMRWDEERFGREYDLDIFMIVAVEDFNMGAMENKGLNIFNTSCVLASADTATDQAYMRVEGVVAHEYFHNWSGNRVTCRDWFQLSLKEGFTVFRDAEFSSDMNSRTVKRIEDVSFLRSVQFAEDASPLSHPIRPESYIEISNFYTPTVYEKGAEVIGMLHTIVGENAFRRGSDLYFERHDGEAATTEDFLKAMADESGKDLSVFARWYRQAGTPVLEVISHWDDGTLTLSLEQSCPPTPGQPEKLPVHIPVALGLLAFDGAPLAPDSLSISSTSDLDVRGDTIVVHLTEASGEVRVSGLAEAPIVSLLRGFSAPVRLSFERDSAEARFLAVHDTDGFAAWDVLQSLLVDEIYSLQSKSRVSPELLALFASLQQRALTAVGASDAEDRFMLAAKLAVPPESYLFEQFPVVDVDALCAARDKLIVALSTELLDGWRALYQACAAPGSFAPDAAGMSRRALRNLALGYLSEALSAEELNGLLVEHMQAADNLTERRAGLVAAVNASTLEVSVRDELLEAFYQRFHREALVVNQWFSLQAGARTTTADGIRRLAEHDAFDVRNPNKVRSLYSAFVQTNLRHFHAIDGSGYRLIADMVLVLNSLNPQMASALAKPLTRWRRFSGARPTLMRQALERIAEAENLSPDVFEVVSKSLADR